MSDLSTVEEVEAFLEHYGVKGMKWGVRRSEEQSAARSERKEISANRRNLSDGDLQKYVTRLKQEKELKKLIDEDINAGKTFAKSVLSNSGRTVLTTALTTAGVYGIRAALQKKFDPKEAAEYLKPKKK